MHNETSFYQSLTEVQVVPDLHWIKKSQALLRACDLDLTHKSCVAFICTQGKVIILVPVSAAGSAAATLLLAKLVKLVTEIEHNAAARPTELPFRVEVRVVYGGRKVL